MAATWRKYDQRGPRQSQSRCSLAGCMTAFHPPSLPQAARHWQCGCGKLPSRLADTARDAGALLDYPGGLAILMGGYRNHIGDRLGKSAGTGTWAKARVGGRNNLLA